MVERIAPTGEVRRRVPAARELALLVVPAAGFDGELAEAAEAFQLRQLRADPGERRYAVPAMRGLELVLHLCEPEEWAVRLLTTTGPRRYVAELTRPRADGGLLPEGLRLFDGRVWAAVGTRAAEDAHADAPEHSFNGLAHVALPVGSEGDVFGLLGVPQVPPWLRR